MSEDAEMSDLREESLSSQRVNSLPLLAPASSPSVRKAGANSSSEDWRPPVQRHVDKTGTLLFSTLRVRILNGDVERNYSIQFKEMPLKVSNVSAGIARKEGIPTEVAHYFRLWIVGKDLELQLNDSQSIDELTAQWPDRMLQYTHYPECKNSRHPINRYWFVYRHKAGLTNTEVQHILSHEVSLKLLYGEVRRNILTNRYLFPSQESLIFLAALQLQILHGDYDLSQCEEIRGKKEFFESIIPIGTVVSSKLVSRVLAVYESLQGMKETDARMRFIQVTQGSFLFGSSFFAVCEERPPLGFFEYRVQKWLLAVNANGLSVIDTKEKEIISSFSWPDIQWTYNEMEFRIKCLSNDKRSIRLLSPQSPLIDQIATRCKLRWVKAVLEGEEPVSLPLEIVIPPSAPLQTQQKTSLTTRFKFTRVRPTSSSKSHQKQKVQMPWASRAKELVGGSSGKSRVKRPANSIFDLDRGMEGLGSDRRLNIDH